MVCVVFGMVYDVWFTFTPQHVSTTKVYCQIPLADVFASNGHPALACACVYKVGSCSGHFQVLHSLVLFLLLLPCKIGLHCLKRFSTSTGRHNNRVEPLEFVWHAVHTGV